MSVRSGGYTAGRPSPLQTPTGYRTSIGGDGMMGVGMGGSMGTPQHSTALLQAPGSRLTPTSAPPQSPRYAGLPASSSNNYAGLPRKEEGEWFPEDQPAPKRYSCMGKLFLRQHNEDFADRAELALRSAVMVLLMGLPCIMPKGTFPQVDAVAEDGFFSKQAIMKFLLIVDMTLGQTSANGFSALFGTGLALLGNAFNCLIIPGGVVEETSWYSLIPVWVFASIFVFCVLYLNLNMTTRIFGLTAFAQHFMAFLDPLKRMAPVGTLLKDPALCELATIGVAGVAALVCNLFPRPMVAIWKARETADELNMALGRAWVNCAADYTGALPDDRTDLLMADISRVRKALDNLDGLLSNSWYEVGFRGTSRNYIARLRRTLQESADRLCCTWRTCLNDHDPTGTKLMQQVREKVREVVVEAIRSIDRSTECAFRGRAANEEEVLRLKEGADKCRIAVTELTKEFRRVKGVNRPPVMENMLEDYTFLVHVCAFGRLAEDLAHEFIQAQKNEAPLPPAGSPQTMIDTAVLSSNEHMKFVRRGFVAIAAAFVWGVYGHAKTGRVHDPGAAVCVALMMRKCISSSAVLSTHRLRGVAVGTIVGQTVYTTCGWCTNYGYALSSIALLCWVGMSCYQHHETARLSSGLRGGYTPNGPTAGLLSAYCCARCILQPCVDEVLTFRDALGTDYYFIINGLVAVFITYAVDHVFASQSTCDLAADALYKTFKSTNEAVSDILDPDRREVQRVALRTLSHIRTAHALADMAQREPRLWRTPWRSALYRDAVQSAHRMRFAFVGMEYCAMGDGRGRSNVEPLKRLTKLASFDDMRKLVNEQLELVQKLVDIALTHEKGLMTLSDESEDLTRKFGKEFRGFASSFYTEANKEVRDLRQPDNSSLETDPAAQASALLNCLTALVDEAARLQDAVLRRAWS